MSASGGPDRKEPLSRPKGVNQRGSGQEKADIQAEGYLPEVVRAGKDRYPGRRVSAEGCSGRKRPISWPKGVNQRGSGQEKGLILPDGCPVSGQAGPPGVPKTPGEPR